MSHAASSLSGPVRPVETVVRGAKPRRSAAIVGITALLAIAATLGFTRWWPSEAPTKSDVVAHVALALPEGVELGSTNLLPIALSPDGTRVAYVGLRDGKNRIYVRALSDPEPKALEGTDGGDGPFFSPDGQWIAFFTNTKLNTGARYNPSTNAWTAIPTAGAPAGRDAHVAVWTGSQMIVWGGVDGSTGNQDRIRTGGR